MFETLQGVDRMVAPPSFESPSTILVGSSRTGALQDSTARQSNPRQPEIPTPSTQNTGQGDPVRGDRPVSQSLSTPFVAQFIAQELNPPASRAPNPVDTARAFDAFRQALANADRGREPER
jgi:hypothetical protein